MEISTIRTRYLALMRTTCAILGNVLLPVSQEIATTWRDKSDGPQGWTVLEVTCHLRDFDIFFRRRAEMMLVQDRPQLPAHDHEALVIERQYNAQDLQQTYRDLAASRQQFVALFENLTDEAWERSGIHPERGHFTMTDALIQVGSHDLTHVEQITRILREGA